MVEGASNLGTSELAAGTDDARSERVLPALTIKVKSGNDSDEDDNISDESDPSSPTAQELSKMTDAEVKAAGGKWSQEEDDRLREIVKEHGPKNWKVISKLAFNGSRSDVQCLHRWQKVLRPGLVKGPWLQSEDEIIVHLIKQHGIGNIKWSEIAANLPGRLGKQCRERWVNHLDPDLKKSAWSEEEDRVLMEKQVLLGNKWREIAVFLPGRSENSVKNRWNSARRKHKRNEAALADGKLNEDESEQGSFSDLKPKKERKDPKPKTGKRPGRPKGSTNQSKRLLDFAGMPIKKNKKKAEAGQFGQQGDPLAVLSQQLLASDGLSHSIGQQHFLPHGQQALGYNQASLMFGHPESFLNPSSMGMGFGGSLRHGGLSPTLNEFDMFLGGGAPLMGKMNFGLSKDSSDMFHGMDRPGALSPGFLNAANDQQGVGFGMGGGFHLPAANMLGPKSNDFKHSESKPRKSKNAASEDLLDLYGNNEVLLRSLVSPPPGASGALSIPMLGGSGFGNDESDEPVEFTSSKDVAANAIRPNAKKAASSRAEDGGKKRYQAAPKSHHGDWKKAKRDEDDEVIPEDDKEGEQGAADFMIIGKSLSKGKHMLGDDMAVLEDKSFFKSRSRSEFARMGEDVEVLGLSNEGTEQEDMFGLFTFEDLVGDLVD